MSHLRSFGQYVLQLRPLKLWGGNSEVKLTQRQLNVLAVLVEADGRVVSKDAFFERVWSGSAVEESNLTQTIFLLRRALGTLPNGGAFIETIPRQGYRLSARAYHADPPSAGRPQLTVLQNGAHSSSDNDENKGNCESIESYALYILDPAGHVLTWKRGRRSGGGYRHREVLGKHHAIFFTPEDIEANAPERELSTADRLGLHVGEGWRLRRSGERFWASFAITAIRDHAGKLICFVKVVRDTTDQKRKDDALRQAKALLRHNTDKMVSALERSRGVRLSVSLGTDHLSNRRS